MFRRIGIVRTKARDAEPIAALPAPPSYTWRLPATVKPRAPPQAVLASSTYIIGENALTPAAVRLIIKRTARRAATITSSTWSARSSMWRSLR